MENPFQSKRLVYRAVEPSEDEAFFLQIQTDPIGYRNSNATINKPQGKASAARYMKQVGEDCLIGVIICLPAPHADAKPVPIGCVHLASSTAAMVHHRHSELGIDILPPYQGQGYGSEAINWILDWAFHTSGLHRVLIRAFAYNTGAIRLYEKLGFTREGVSREEIWHAGRYWDGIHLSMLDREWKELRKSDATSTDAGDSQQK